MESLLKKDYMKRDAYLMRFLRGCPLYHILYAITCCGLNIKHANLIPFPAEDLDVDKAKKKTMCASRLNLTAGPVHDLLDPGERRKIVC